MATSNNKNGFRLPKWLYIYWKILGVCPVVFVENNIIINKRGGLFYAVLLSLAYTFLYSRIVVARVVLSRAHKTSSTVTTDFLGLSMEFLTIITSWFFFAFRQNKIRKIIKMVTMIKKSLKTSQIDPKSEDFIRTLQVSTIFINLVWLVLYSCDHLFIYVSGTFRYDVLLPFNVPRIVSHNVVIMFVNCLLTVKNIFHLLNNGINDLPWDAAVEPRSRQDFRKVTETRAEPGALEIYGQIHSDLVTLTKEIVHFFSLCIILAILGHLYLMASDLYMLCMMIKDKDILGSEECVPFLVISSWLAFHVVETVVIVAISESTANEANRAGKILHRMLIGANVESYACTGELLSLRLLHRHLTISLWGLLRMRLSIVHTILGTVVTYITIMMQFDGLNIQATPSKELTVEETNT